MSQTAKNSLRRLTIQLEISSQVDFDTDQFQELIDSALKNLLGVAGPTYTFGEFDSRTRKGSILVEPDDLNQVWAALSLYGRHHHYNVAMHLNSITIPED